MSDTYTIERDLKEAQAMSNALDRYVRGNDLYGSAGGGGFFSSGQMPSLTVGALLMRLRRLNALRDEMSDNQLETLDGVIHQHDVTAEEWRVHYTEKMTREANSRLDAMRTFFEECASSPKLCANVYRPEALRRTIVEELLMAMDEMNVEVDDDLRKKVRGIDSQLRRYVRPDEFIWSDQLQSVYPEKAFWWLYNRPPMPEN